MNRGVGAGITKRNDIVRLLRLDLDRARAHWSNILSARDRTSRIRAIPTILGTCVSLCALLYLASPFVSGMLMPGVLSQGDWGSSVAASIGMVLLLDALRRGLGRGGRWERRYLEEWLAVQGVPAVARAAREVLVSVGRAGLFAWLPLFPLAAHFSALPLRHRVALFFVGIAFALLGDALAVWWRIASRPARIGIAVSLTLWWSSIAVDVLDPENTLAHTVGPAALWRHALRPDSGLLWIALLFILFGGTALAAQVWRFSRASGTPRPSAPVADGDSRGVIRSVNRRAAFATAFGRDMYRLRRWCRREPASILVLVGLTSVLYLLAWRTPKGAEATLLTGPSARLALTFILGLPTLALTEAMWDNEPVLFWSYLRIADKCQLNVISHFLSVFVSVAAWAVVLGSLLAAARNDVAVVTHHLVSAIPMCLFAVSAGVFASVAALKMGIHGKTVARVLRYSAIGCGVVVPIFLERAMSWNTVVLCICVASAFVTWAATGLVNMSQFAGNGRVTHDAEPTT